MSEDDTEPEVGEGEAGLDDEEAGVEEGLGWAVGMGDDDAGVGDDDAGVEEGLAWLAAGEVSTGEAEGAYECHLALHLEVHELKSDEHDGAPKTPCEASASAMKMKEKGAMIRCSA
jgi:hypothetical protein